MVYPPLTGSRVARNPQEVERLVRDIQEERRSDDGGFHGDFSFKVHDEPKGQYSDDGLRSVEMIKRESLRALRELEQASGFKLHLRRTFPVCVAATRPSRWPRRIVPLQVVRDKEAAAAELSSAVSEVRVRRSTELVELLKLTLFVRSQT